MNWTKEMLENAAPTELCPNCGVSYWPWKEHTCKPWDILAMDDDPTADGIGPMLTYGEYKQVGPDSRMWQVAVTGNEVTVMCRLKAMDSHFEFLWSSRAISEDSKTRICDSAAWTFWG